MTTILASAVSAVTTDTLVQAIECIDALGQFHAGGADEDAVEEALDLLDLSDEDDLTAFAATPLGRIEVVFLPNAQHDAPIVWRPADDTTLGDLCLMAVDLRDLLARVSYWANTDTPIATVEDAQADRDEGPEACELDRFATQDVVGWQAVENWHTNAFLVTGSLVSDDDGRLVIQLYSES